MTGTPATTRWVWKVDAGADRADLAILRALEEGGGQWSGSAISPSRSQLKKLIEEGHVTSDGKPLKSNTKLKTGAEIRIHFPEPKTLDLKPEDIPIDVLYDDEHLLVLNKPAGLTVHPSSTQTEGTLVHALLHHVKDLSTIGGVLRPGIVHRIDKDTSGALVITKTDQAHRALSETFSKHDIERSYWALCYGSPKEVGSEKRTKIESMIARNPNDRKKMASVKTGGRKAITWVRKIEEFVADTKKGAFASWLELTLETGRTHQIRVHLTGLGHSILGDPVYGTPTEKQPKWLALPKEVQALVHGLQGQALHARLLGFKHPVTGKQLRFEADPPPEFQKLLDTLRKYRKI